MESGCTAVHCVLCWISHQNLLLFARSSTVASRTVTNTGAANSSSSGGSTGGLGGRPADVWLTEQYLDVLEGCATDSVLQEGRAGTEGLVRPNIVTPAWLLEGVAGQLARITESYVRLCSARGATAAGLDTQPACEDQQQQQCDWGWVEVLCAGPHGVLQRVSEQHPLGGEFQRSFLSCLCSLLKLAGGDERLRDAATSQQVLRSVLYSVVDALQRSLPICDASGVSVVAAADGGGAAAVAAAAAAAAAASSGDLVTADAAVGVDAAGGGCVAAGEGIAGPLGGLACLPAVVLFGRCCVQLADFWEGLDVASGLSPDQLELVKSLFGGDGFGLKGKVVAGWLQVFEPQLSAAGYPMQPVLQQMQGLTGAANAVEQAVGPGQGMAHALTATAVAAVTELVQCLRAVGAAAGVIPVPDFCNNGGCVNVCGPSEVLLVSGRSCICAGCRTARYCGRGCQRQAWKQHKPVCKALAAAAAATAGAAAEGAGNAS